MSNQVIIIVLALLAGLYLGFFCWAVKYRNGRNKTELKTIAVLEELDK